MSKNPGPLGRHNRRMRKAFAEMMSNGDTGAIKWNWYLHDWKLRWNQWKERKEIST